MESWRVFAYAVVDNITYPLLFKIFKPRSRLQPGDVYKTKPELAVEILQELEEWKFQIELVLADSLYGESVDVIRELERLKLPFIVAIRSNHGVLMAQGQKVRYNRWRAYTQLLSHHPRLDPLYSRNYLRQSPLTSLLRNQQN